LQLSVLEDNAICSVPVSIDLCHLKLTGVHQIQVHFLNEEKLKALSKIENLVPRHKSYWVSLRHRTCYNCQQ
jgi:hypothetical protein